MPAGSVARPLSATTSRKLRTRLVGVPEQLAERRLLRAMIDLGVIERRAQLGDGARGFDEVAELLGDRGDAVLLLRGVEERASGVDAVRDGYLAASRSSTLKSRLADRLVDQAAVIVEVSTRDVTFSAAISARFATSRRISARRAASPLRFGGTSLQPPLAVLFGLQPHALALQVGHASRLGEDLVRLAARLAGGCRCSSRSRRASSRALSASSIDCRMRSRRWSIAC